jgi:hypothetical protein
MITEQFKSTLIEMGERLYSDDKRPTEEEFNQSPWGQMFMFIVVLLNRDATLGTTVLEDWKLDVECMVAKANELGLSDAELLAAYKMASEYVDEEV